VKSGAEGRGPTVGDLKESLLALPKYAGRIIKYVRSLNNFGFRINRFLSIGARLKKNEEKLKAKRTYMVKFLRKSKRGSMRSRKDSQETLVEKDNPQPKEETRGKLLETRKEISKETLTERNRHLMHSRGF